MTLRVEMLPASEGDCLLIRWDDRFLVVDGGRAGTWPALRDRLAALAAEGLREAELLVVTHVDRDHIEGVLSLVEDDACPVRFKDVWFNGFGHLSDLEEFGGVQGERLTAALLAAPGRWNAAFGGKAVCVERAPEPVQLEGGLSLRVLSPSRAKLRVLRGTWARECAAAGLVAGEAAALPVVPPALEAFGPLDVAQLAGTPFQPDAAPANGSSIALLLEWRGRRVLLGADAHPEELLAALRRLSPDARVALDAFKVPHHGSKHNVSLDLVGRVDCPSWLVSTSGSYFKHPDRAAIARILHAAGREVELVFNYRSDYTGIWDDDALRAAHGYRTRFLAPGEAAVELAPAD